MQPPNETVLPIEEALAAVLARTGLRVQIDPTQAWAPLAGDTRRFALFVAHNESRWQLAIDPTEVPFGTLYESTDETEEGGTVSEYLSFEGSGVTWWFDGRRDEWSEFKNPQVRSKRVSRLFLAVHDGKSGWTPISRTERMPLDYGLSIGIELEDGSFRYW